MAVAVQVDFGFLLTETLAANGTAVATAGQGWNLQRIDVRVPGASTTDATNMGATLVINGLTSVPIVMMGEATEDFDLVISRRFFPSIPIGKLGIYLTALTTGGEVILWKA